MRPERGKIRRTLLILGVLSLLFAALSDTHVQDEKSGPRAKTSNAKLARALQDSARFNPDLYVFNGDVTNSGSASEYETFARILHSTIPGRPTLAGIGNHEFYSTDGDDALALERFNRAFGLTRPYRDGVGQADQLRRILSRNPQVRLWFSGHTHRPLTSEGQSLKQGNTWFFGLGSTFYTLVPSAGGAGPRGCAQDYEANMSRLVDVYSDRVVVRVRDHREGQWLSDLEVNIAR